MAAVSRPDNVDWMQDYVGDKFKYVMRDIACLTSWVKEVCAYVDCDAADLSGYNVTALGAGAKLVDGAFYLPDLLPQIKAVLKDFSTLFEYDPNVHFDTKLRTVVKDVLLLVATSCNLTRWLHATEVIDVGEAINPLTGVKCVAAMYIAANGAVDNIRHPVVHWINPDVEQGQYKNPASYAPAHTQTVASLNSTRDVGYMCDLARNVSIFALNILVFVGLVSTIVAPPLVMLALFTVNLVASASLFFAMKSAGEQEFQLAPHRIQVA